jgi:branched-chain amino acid transport system ATP-binding protein
MTLLELSGVSVHYGRIRAVDDLSITVEEGEIVTLIGANGAGKSTTMRAISGIRPVSSGRITFAGEDITRLRADLRVVRGISQAPEGRGSWSGCSSSSRALPSASRSLAAHFRVVNSRCSRSGAR